MILSFFSPPLRGELLYSALARYGVCRGLTSPKAAMREIFGRSATVATMDLPNNLLAFVERVFGADQADQAASLIKRHTLFPYYTTFQSPERREAARQAMLGTAGSVHLLLGVATFRTGRPEYLQFCPMCLTEMEDEHGFPHWRADHQLPGVLVCPDHACRLRQSRVCLSTVNRHAYFAASPEVCSSDCDPITRRLMGRTLDLAVEVARASQALLLAEPIVVDQTPICESYRSRLAQAGLMRGRLKVDQARLEDCLNDHFGELLGRLRGVELSASTETWLNSIVRSSSGAHPPLQHLLLNLLLDAQSGLHLQAGANETQTPATLKSKQLDQSTTIDWRRIDLEYAAEMRARAQILRRAQPPARITVAALERGYKPRNWLSKRRSKLPYSVSVIESLVEDTEGFRLRRLRWHLARCIADGIYDPWQVIRRAGLPHRHIDLVRAELERVTANDETRLRA